MVNPEEAIAMKIGWCFFWGGRTNQKPEIAANCPCFSLETAVTATKERARACTRPCRYVSRKSEEHEEKRPVYHGDKLMQVVGFLRHTQSICNF